MNGFIARPVAPALIAAFSASGAAKADAGLIQDSCYPALAALGDQWNAVGLRAPPAGPRGAIQAKLRATVTLRNGQAASLTRLQHMTMTLHAASAACQAGHADLTMGRIALPRDRLDTLSN